MPRIILVVLAALIFCSSAQARPYDAQALFNRLVPASKPDDPNSISAVNTFTSFARNNPSNVHLLTSGEVPALNITQPGDPTFNVRCGSLSTTFQGPWPLKLGSGSDHPTEVLNKANWLELRCWQASVSGNTLYGNGGSLSYWNSNGAILNPDSACNKPGDRLPCESLGQPFQGGGAGNGLTYFAGLTRPYEVKNGVIPHAIRFAGFAITSSYRPPARKSDQGSTSSGAVPMGSVFQLRPSVDCSVRTAAGMSFDSLQSRGTRTFCRAMQRYGGMMSDGAGQNLSAYLEDRQTATWSNALGSTAGHPSYSFIIRPGGRSTDGVPWDAASWRLVAAPASYTSW